MDDKWIEKLDILGFNENFEWEIVDKCWWVFSVGGGYGPSILRVGEGDPSRHLMVSKGS